VALDAFLLIILSAFIQATWNFVAKKSSANRAVLIYVGWFMVGLITLPAASLVTDFSNFSPTWLYFIISSSVIHIAYVAFLGWGYAKGDISMVYPIARGVGIAGTTIVALFISVDVALCGILGIICITSGTALIGLRESFRKESQHAFFIAVGTGIIVAAYSIVDSAAVKTVPPLFYVAAINLIPAVLAAPILLLRYRPEVGIVLRTHKKESFFVAAAGTVAYVLILYAFQKTPAAYVVALREFSVVIAAGLGVVVLKEKLYKRKIIAIVLILVGMVIIKLAN
jgi:drug/metabolite transporter (DMT)-like permease